MCKIVMMLLVGALGKNLRLLHLVDGAEQQLVCVDEAMGPLECWLVFLLDSIWVHEE